MHVPLYICTYIMDRYACSPIHLHLHYGQVCMFPYAFALALWAGMHVPLRICTCIMSRYACSPIHLHLHYGQVCIFPCFGRVAPNIQEHVHLLWASCSQYTGTCTPALGELIPIYRYMYTCSDSNTKWIRS